MEATDFISIVLERRTIIDQEIISPSFFNNIEGFNYEPGYEYLLTVSTTKIENPPADGSSIKYTLIKQISKTKISQN